MMSHSRDISSFLKKSGNESLNYKKFASEQDGTKSPWSIIDSVSGAKPVMTQESRDEYTSMSMTRSAGYESPGFDSRLSQPQASEPDRYFKKTSFSEPERHSEQEYRPEPEPRQDTAQRFGHLFSQVGSSIEQPARSTPLKALLQRIAS